MPDLEPVQFAGPQPTHCDGRIMEQSTILRLSLLRTTEAGFALLGGDGAPDVGYSSIRKSTPLISRMAQELACRKFDNVLSGSQLVTEQDRDSLCASFAIAYQPRDRRSL